MIVKTIIKDGTRFEFAGIITKDGNRIGICGLADSEEELQEKIKNAERRELNDRTM